MTPKPHLSTIAAVLVAAVLFSGLARAGTGSAISDAAIIDTRAPVVVVVNLFPNIALRAGQVVPFLWILTDDNPATGPTSTVVEVWVSGQIHESQNSGSLSGEYRWYWTVPDISSGSVHLVVRSADAFGNLTVAQNRDFTILSSITDVPSTGAGAVFELPAPNPFNPLTVLRFDLPETGPIQVTVHDARGARVATLLQAHQSAGPLTLRWRGTDDAGRRQAGGTYFFRLEYRQSGQVNHIVHKAALLP